MPPPDEPYDVGADASLFAQESIEKLEQSRLEYALLKEKGARGWIGTIFGSTGEKQGNIAGFALIAFILLFAAVLFFFGDSTVTISKKEALAIVGGFITLTLGYVFGKSG